MLHHKAPHRPWEPDARTRRSSRTLDPRAGHALGRYATRTDALHENQQRVAADLTRRDLKLEPPAGSHGRGADELARRQARSTVTIARDGKTVTLTGEALVRWKYQRYMQDYLATVQSVDDNVGRLLAYLDAQRPRAEHDRRSTPSDQGFFLGDHGMFDKRFMYEESLRMPFLVRWPAGIKPGTRSDAIALNVDFAPTFLEAAGLPVPADMQGRSLLPVLRGRRARRLAHLDVLPLLPRPRRPQHARPLRRPHAHAQADLLLEEGPVGAVRPRERSVRAAQPLRRARPGAADGDA